MTAEVSLLAALADFQSKAFDPAEPRDPATGRWVTLFHITDRHHFALDPKRAPQDNAFAIEDRSGRRGVYLTDDPDHWRALGYHRPYIAEIRVPEGLAYDERWGGEKFLPAEHFDQATVTRVIPFDAHQREKYGEPGSVESYFGTHYENDTPIEMRPSSPGNFAREAPVSRVPEATDVRSISKEAHQRHVRRLREYRRATQGKAFHPDQPRVPKGSPGAGRWGVVGAVEDLLTPHAAPRGVGQQWYSAIMARQHAMGLTPEKEARVNAILRETMADHQVWSRIPSHLLERVLNDGLKSQHDTQSSSGAYAPMQRMIVEKVLHGLDTSVEPPVIYGYASASPVGDLTDIEQVYDALGQYGDLAIRLKPEVRERTTVTFGDSLDDSGIATVGNLGLLEEGTWDLLMPEHVGHLASFAPTPLTNPTTVALPTRVITQVEEMEKQYKRGLDPVALSKRDFIEAQIIDGVRPSDIAEVVFNDQSYDYRLTDLLESRGISWSLVNTDDEGETDIVDSWSRPESKAFDPHEPRDHFGRWVSLREALKFTPTTASTWDRVEAGINAKHPDYLDRLTADTVNGLPLTALHVTPDGRVVRGHASLLAARRAKRKQVLVRTVPADTETDYPLGLLDAKVLSLAAEFDAKFDPHEPRDPFGRWMRGEIPTTSITPKVEANTLDWMTERGVTAQALHTQTHAILDRASPEALEYGQPWYANAHAHGERLAAEHGVSLQEACAVLAALSPRNAWRREDDPKFHSSGNVESARQVLDAVHNPIRLQKITHAHVARAKKLYRIDIGHLYGTRPMTSDLTAIEQAALDFRSKGLPDNKIKAFKIARREGMITDVLGGPKVRSFYNNINKVDDSVSVTVDSHQVRAMMGRIDLPDKVYEEIASNPGRYQFFADVVRQVAKERGIPPRVVQAITWEQWRLEHPAEFREENNPSNIATARDITLGSVVYAAPTVAKTPKRPKRKP